MRLYVLESARYYVVPTPQKRAIGRPEDAARLMAAIAKREQREVFVVFLLNSKNCVRRAHVISIGTLNASIIHPREVFVPAVRHSAAAILIAHNHPSGVATPSREDIAITKRIQKAGEILGIDLLDHIIIGGESHVSLKELGVI